MAHFWEWLLPAEQTQPSPAGDTQQSQAAPELWAELSKELLLRSEQRQHQIYRFLGYIAKEKWELVAVLFPASISQTKPLSFLFHCRKPKPWAAFFIFSFFANLTLLHHLLHPQAGTCSCKSCFIHVLYCAHFPLQGRSAERYSAMRYLNAEKW